MTENWGRRFATDADVTSLRKGQLTSIRARLKLQERVERLEDELSWTSLVASAVAGICIEKGLVTPDELKERLAKLDLLSHTDAGAPDAAAPSPDSPPAPAATPSQIVARRRRFLRQRK